LQTGNKIIDDFIQEIQLKIDDPKVCVNLRTA